MSISYPSDDAGLRVNFHGPVGGSGYGRFTNFLCPAMVRQGLDVHVLSTYPNEQLAEPELLKDLVVPFNSHVLNPDVAIRLSIGTPYESLMFHGKKRVYYTMLESTRIPPYWVDALNTMDQVWATSTWGKQTFTESGVKVPINIVPGGVEPTIFNPKIEPYTSESGNFRFLSVGKWEIRKGYDILLKAYCEEFKANERVELILHPMTIQWFVGSNFNIFEELFNLDLPNNHAPVNVVKQVFPNYADMARLYRLADCFVNPTRGEGWNLPLCESMACGVPSIATNWSSHTEYITEQNCMLLKDYQIVPSIHPAQIYQEFLRYGKWAEPSVKELREKMRYAFDNQDEIKKYGTQAAEDMRAWTWDNAAKKAKTYLEELCK